MEKKIVLYFDDCSARTMALEHIFANDQNIEFYAYDRIQENLYRIDDYGAGLVISSQKIESKAPLWLLQRDLLLPMSPIEVKKAVLDFFDISST